MQHSPSSSRSSASEPLIRIRGLTTRIGGAALHRDLDLDVRAGEVLAVVGASGSGKSVLLRAIVGLFPIAAGKITVFGRDLAALNEHDGRQVEARWGVLFEYGALFSSLTVAENIAVPLREQLDLPPRLRDEIC